MPYERVMVSTSMLLEFGWIVIPWEYFDDEGKSSRSLCTCTITDGNETIQSKRRQLER
jgi:hypothetical protein